MPARIFISYSQEDKAAYSSLCLAIENSGVSRWDVSELSIGRPLADGLRAAIAECDLCVFLATARSLKSQWCLAELGAFWGAGKKVLVFQADPNIRESDHPPQFQGNLWTSDARQLLRAIKEVERGPILPLEDGYGVVLGSSKFNVRFGRIEKIDHSADDWLVALPANEYFDDECINDPRSALGAFMKHHFNDKIIDIQELVRGALSKERSEQMRKTPEISANSYGVGKCVFLSQPLSASLRIAMVSVTTHRVDVGLRADPAYVFEAAASLHRLMANRRLSRLCVPIFGSGHGGLRGEISLLCMLTAFSELSRRAGQNLREVNIIVYKQGESTTPSISEANVKHALAYIHKLWLNSES